MAKTAQLALVGGVVLLSGLSAMVFTLMHLKPHSIAKNAFSESVTLRGTAVKGAVLTSSDSQGRSLSLKIQNVEPDPKDQEKQVYLYTVTYQDSDTLQWQNLCQPDREGVAKAIPLAGQWDSHGRYLETDEVTLACTNSALAKCVRWGYKPWKTIRGKSLRDFHQACTRMVRADYCGTGVAHTQEGTPIDVYDMLGVQKRVKNNGMVFEAAWSPDGAAAISKTRFKKTWALIQQDCPERIRHLGAEDTIDHDSSQTLSKLQQYAPRALIFNDSFLNQ